jgi:hypothetical protein
LRHRHERLIEVRAGKLEGEDTDSRIARKPRRKTDFVRNPRGVFEAYMNPGRFAERLTFFAARTAGSKTKGKKLKS